MQEEIESLERDITLLSRAMSFPETPSLVTRVRSHIEAERARRAPAPAWKLALTGVAAAAVALAFVAGVLAPARDAVADLFDRINIFEVEEIPEGLPTDITGEEVTLAEAGQRFGFPLKLPTYPEGIDSSLTKVLYNEFEPSGLRSVALFYEPPGGAPFVLFQTNAGAGKGLGPGAEAEFVPGVGQEAYWLEGLRIVEYFDPAGESLEVSRRVTEANTLLWAEEGQTFRLEGDLSQDEAIKIAQSLR